MDTNRHEGLTDVLRKAPEGRHIYRNGSNESGKLHRSGIDHVRSDWPQKMQKDAKAFTGTGNRFLTGGREGTEGKGVPPKAPEGRHICRNGYNEGGKLHRSGIDHVKSEADSWLRHLRYLLRASPFHNFHNFHTGLRNPFRAYTET
jgi:hypothetical protein